MNKYAMIDYKKPLDEFNNAERDYFNMETQRIAEQIADRYTSKGHEYLMAISLHLKDIANARRPKSKSQPQE